MNKLWPIMRFVFRIGIPLGVLALAVTYWQEVKLAFWQAFDVGAIFLLLFPLFGVWNHVATLGWRALVTVVDQKKAPSIWRLSLIRLEAQSVNLVLPLSIGAPVVKATLLARENGSSVSSIASVTLDTIASAAAGFMFSAMALGVHWVLIPGGTGSLWALALVALILIVFLCSTSSLAAMANKLRWIDPYSSFGRTLKSLADAGPDIKGPIATCILSHFVERLMMAGEIWIIAYGLGLELSPSHLAFTAAVMTGFTLVFFFIPGQAGAAEGGLALAFSILGLPPTVGLSTGLVRRARQIAVYGIGLTLLFCIEGWKSVRDPHCLETRADSDTNTSCQEGGDSNANPVRSTC